MGPRADLDVVVKRKYPPTYTCQELNPGHPTFSLVTILTKPYKGIKNIKV
jgi:hypothetical protein